MAGRARTEKVNRDRGSDTAMHVRFAKSARKKRKLANDDLYQIQHVVENHWWTHFPSQKREYYYRRSLSSLLVKCVSGPESPDSCVWLSPDSLYSRELDCSLAVQSPL
ncbi:hypothetical protein OIU85_005871 [Salix viminalis]|uniref:Uncharacterized protein n=1 Tax=Salix viminalis TaxID=40686 RepID=A0A9Q0SU48_SALVM|nr:hypothetical protein OIU85_005871 [Salix viminalis]